MKKEDTKIKQTKKTNEKEIKKIITKQDTNKSSDKENVKVIDNKKNISKTNKQSIISTMFKMIANIFKFFGKVIFKIFDFFISFIISIFTYLFFGIKKIVLILYDYIFKSIFMEIYLLFKAMYNGGVVILECIFVSIPTYIFNKIARYVYKTYSNIKNYIDKQKEKRKESIEHGTTLSNQIKKYIKNKYENISFVKAAREKKEASLIVLSINPNSSDAHRSEQKQTYKYLARNTDGKLETGYFSAQSKLDVYSYLIDKGMTVYEITTNWAINFFHTESSSIKRRMKNKDLIFWLAQVSTYIRAGIPLTDAVKVLAQQDKRKRYRAVYDAIIYELTMGESFSEALKKQGSVFPALLVNMVKSAEMIGNIEDTLDEMSDYYQEIEDTKKAIISALTYPSIVLVFAIGIVVFMLVYIVPQFVEVYESMNAELNPITEITLNVSGFIKTKYLNIIAFVLLIVSLYTLLYKKVKLFKTMMQRLFMKLPVVGSIIIYKEISLFSRTFATLNKNNVLLTDSIDILGKITNNEIYKSIMYRTINNLLKGEKMSESFKDHWAVPQTAYYMILTGESTGELAEMLDKVGDYYQKLQKNMINQIKTFIEPVMIIFLALVVGIILVAIIVPMFGIYESIQ